MSDPIALDSPATVGHIKFSAASRFALNLEPGVVPGGPPTVRLHHGDLPLPLQRSPSPPPPAATARTYSPSAIARPLVPPRPPPSRAAITSEGPRLLPAASGSVDNVGLSGSPPGHGTSGQWCVSPPPQRPLASPRVVPFSSGWVASTPSPSSRRPRTPSPTRQPLVSPYTHSPWSPLGTPGTGTSRRLADNLKAMKL